MKAFEIQEYSHLHLGDTMEWVYAKRWINEAIEKIATLFPTGRVFKSIVIDYKKDLSFRYNSLMNKYNNLFETDIEININNLEEIRNIHQDIVKYILLKDSELENKEEYINLSNSIGSIINEIKDTSLAIHNNKLKLPNELIEIRKCKHYKNGEYITINDFDIDINFIEFDKDGIYILEYEGYPPKVENKEDIPEINEAYHIPITYFVASREKLMFYPDDRDAQRLENHFIEQSKLINENLLKYKKVRKIKS